MVRVAAKNLPSSGCLTLTDTDSCSPGSFECRVLHATQVNDAACHQVQSSVPVPICPIAKTMSCSCKSCAPNALHVHQRRHV